MTAPLAIHAPGIDAAAIVEDIRATVERKRAEGAYADPRIVRAERTNLAQLRDDEDFHAYYMSCLREAFAIDINDFEIVERRGGLLGGLLVRFKRSLWTLLKFYTYRLWSQQNQVNGLLLTALETTDQRYRERIAALEQRLANMEAQATAHDRPRT